MASHAYALAMTSKFTLPLFMDWRAMKEGMSVASGADVLAGYVVGVYLGG